MKTITKTLLGLSAAGAAYVLIKKARNPAQEASEAAENVHGFVAPGFEGVRDAFIENFTTRGEVGGACCVYRHGVKVVDLWGGLRNKLTGEPWEEDTMVIVHSSTKGLAAMTLAVAHSRGWLDYDARVSEYWPEFAQNGKENITVRQLLAHQAGLFAFDEPVDKATVADLDRLAEIMARQKPAWEPGSRQAYHALTIGFYEGELLRRVDPQHRSLGQFFQDEIATPLGLDFYIRVPQSIPNSRFAVLVESSKAELLFGMPFRFVLSMWNPNSNLTRALFKNPGAAICMDEQTVYCRELEVPAGGGVGTARAIAYAYGVFANGGAELGLRPDTIRELSAPAVPSEHGFHDECLKVDTRFLLGFMKSGPEFPFGRPNAFGAPGAGGSIGFADPDAGIGYAYVTNRMRATLGGDPRDAALREAVYKALDVAGQSRAAAAGA